ncbi:translation initiation factor [bacterium]|nr:translation initiation factor [bacterium]
MGKRKVDLGAEGEQGLTHNPFAALRRGAPGVPGSKGGPGVPGEGGEAATAREEPVEVSPDRAMEAGAHWLVRKERKGRGGKVVTIVSSLAGVDVRDLGDLARALGQRLGTGARVKGGEVVVQGELSERVARFLESKGARVTVGS